MQEKLPKKTALNWFHHSFNFGRGRCSNACQSKTKNVSTKISSRGKALRRRAPLCPFGQGEKEEGENKGLENNRSPSLHFRPRPHTFIFIAIFSSTSTYHHHEAKQWEFHFRPHPQLSFSSTLFFSCGSSLNFQQTTFQSEISVLASELQTKNYLQVIIILSLKCHQNSDPRQAFLT